MKKRPLRPITEARDWYDLSVNPSLPWELVRDNPDEPWDWVRLSRNPNISWEIVRDNPDKPWDWHSFSANPNVTWEIVQGNLDKPWDWRILSTNPFQHSPPLLGRVLARNRPFDSGELSETARGFPYRPGNREYSGAKERFERNRR